MSMRHPLIVWGWWCYLSVSHLGHPWYWLLWILQLSLKMTLWEAIPSSSPPLVPFPTIWWYENVVSHNLEPPWFQYNWPLDQIFPLSDGNFNAKFNKLKKAKFSFMLECPSDPAYSDDWDRLLGGLDKTQSAIAFTKDKQNLIEGATKSICFAVPIFEKRVHFSAFAFHPPKGVFFFQKINQMWRRWWRLYVTYLPPLNDTESYFCQQHWTKKPKNGPSVTASKINLMQSNLHTKPLCLPYTKMRDLLNYCSPTVL